MQKIYKQISYILTLKVEINDQKVKKIRARMVLLIYYYLQLDVQLILTGANKHGDKGIHSYQQYLDHLWQVGNTT